MILFYSFLFLISFFGLNFILNKKGNVSFSLTPFLTIVCIITTLYVFGIFGIPLIAAWALYLIGIGSFFYFIYIKIQTNKITPTYLFQSSFFPLYFFAILFLANLFLYRELKLTELDEMAHWGIFTKIITSYHNLIDQYNIIAKADYPRISSLLHYYFILFLNKGTYNEGITIFAHTNFFISALCFFIFHKKQNLLFSILILITFYLLFGIILHVSISHIYNDAPLALFWALSIILYLSNTKKHFWIVGLVLFCIPQIKEIGILYCCFTLFIIGVNELFFKKELLLHKLKKIGILIGLVIISKLSWFLYIQYKGVDVNSFQLGNKVEYEQVDIDKSKERYFKSLVHVGQYKYPGFWFENDSNYNIKNFVFPSNQPSRIAKILKTITGKESSLYHFLNNKVEQLIIGPIYFILLIIIYLFFVYYYKTSYLETTIFPHGKKHFISFSVSLSFILISYVFIQFFLFLNTSFIPREIVILTSFERYFGSLIIGGILIVLYLISIIRKKRLFLILIVILFLFYKMRPEIETKIKSLSILPIENSTNTQIQNTNKSSKAIFSTPCLIYEELRSNLNIIYERTGENINNEIANMMDSIKKIDDKAIVYIINMEGTDYQKATFLYNSIPLRIIYAPYQITTEVTKENKFVHDRWGKAIISPESFKNRLEKCDYLIIRNDKCSLWEQYGEVIKETKLKGIFISRMP